VGFIEIINVESRERWRVVFKESDKWQVGLYVPENRSLQEVKILEKHDAPELFMLMHGSIVLVLEENGEIKEVPLEYGKLYIVEEWHNAYRPQGKEGIALVVERPSIKTEFKNVSLPS